MRGSEAAGSYPRRHTTTLLCFFRGDRESVVYVYLRLCVPMCRDMCVCVYSLLRRALQTSNDTLRDVSTPKKAPLVGREEEEEEEEGEKGGGDGFPGVAADC